MKPFLYQTNDFNLIASKLIHMQKDTNKMYSHVSVAKRFNDGDCIGVWMIEALMREIPCNAG